MFFYLSKILLFLANPIIWTFILLVWGLLTKNLLLKKKLIWATVICFYFFSNGFITSEFVRAYEETTIHYSDIQQPYDVAIVLGGFSSEDQEQEMVQFYSSTDRLMAGIKLYKTGKAKKIMISSGSGQITKPDEREALFIKNYLLEIGIPEEDLIIESNSKNTHENAVFSANILNKKYSNGNYLLITSAFHMPRAKRCFKQVGLNITPFSVDHQAGPRKFLIDHLLIPNAQNLSLWQILIKEWIGFIAYYVMGYL